MKGNRQRVIAVAAALSPPLRGGVRPAARGSLSSSTQRANDTANNVRRLPSRLLLALQRDVWGACVQHPPLADAPRFAFPHSPSTERGASEIVCSCRPPLAPKPGAGVQSFTVNIATPQTPQTRLCCPQTPSEGRTFDLLSSEPSGSGPVAQPCPAVMRKTKPIHRNKPLFLPAMCPYSPHPPQASPGVWCSYLTTQC